MTMHNAEPVYVGSDAAIAALRAGREMALIPTRLPGGRPAFKVSFLEEPAAAPRPTGQASGQPSAQRLPVFYPTAQPEPWTARPAVQYQPVQPVAQKQVRFPILSHGQKWVVIGGSLGALFLLVLWLVFRAISAIGSMLTGLGAAGMAVVVIAAVLFFIATRPGGGGGNQTINIGARRIKNLTIRK